MVGFDKTYARYETGPDGGIVASPGARSCSCLEISTETSLPVGRRQQHEHSSRPRPPIPLLFVPALEYVAVWNLRSGLLCGRLGSDAAARGASSREVTFVRAFSDPNISSGWTLFAGFGNGHVTCWRGKGLNVSTCESVVDDLGHKYGTSVLCGDWDGQHSAVTGGQDTDLTVWDLADREPLYRFVGHRGAVVGVGFTAKGTHVVSGAADGLIKVWSLELRQCLHTVVACDTHISSLLVTTSGLQGSDVRQTRLLVGLPDSSLPVYALELNLENHQSTTTIATAAQEERNDAACTVVPHGILFRKTHRTVTSLVFSQDGSHCAVLSSQTIEVFAVSSAESVQIRRQRRERRQRERAAKTGSAKTIETSDASPASGSCGDARDEFVSLRLFRFKRAVRSASFLSTVSRMDEDNDWDDRRPELSVKLRLVIIFGDNTGDIVTCQTQRSEVTGQMTLSDLTKERRISAPSHRSDILSVCFASDDTTVAAVSCNEVKLWGLKRIEPRHGLPGLQCTGTIPLKPGHSIPKAPLEAGQQVDESGIIQLPSATELEMSKGDSLRAAVFLPGDEWLAVTTSLGHILMASVTRASFTRCLAHAHQGDITGLCTRNDGVLTCGKDRRLVLWDIALLSAVEQTSTAKRNRDGSATTDTNEKVTRAPEATLISTAETQLKSVPLWVSASLDGVWIAVAVQDNNNVQLLHAESLTPRFTLYGHSLPVTSIDFSSDGELIATGSADKNLRLWSTEHGNCQRAIHAHDAYITAVKFVPDTHYLFTASHDGTVKHWDGDYWTLIQLFRMTPSHQFSTKKASDRNAVRGLWALGVNARGTAVAIGGSDRCLRTIMRTEDLVFPREEHERVLEEAQVEADALEHAWRKLEDAEALATSYSADIRSVAIASPRASDAAERLMQALDLVSVERQRESAEETQYEPSPLLLGKSPLVFLASTLESLAPSLVRHALTSLTSVHLHSLLELLSYLMETPGLVKRTEQFVRVLLAMFTPAPGTLSDPLLILGRHDAEALEQLQRIQTRLSLKLGNERDRVKLNIAGLEFVMANLKSAHGVLFQDVSKIQRAKRKAHSQSLKP